LFTDSLGANVIKFVNSLVSFKSFHKCYKLTWDSSNKSNLTDDLWKAIMAALCNIIFLPYGFYLSFFFFLLFSSRNLSGRRSDVYHTSTHGV